MAKMNDSLYVRMFNSMNRPTNPKLRTNLWDNEWTYREIQSRLEELNMTKEDIEPDLFLIDLGSWNSTFVRTKLDEFFATGQRNQPKNPNLRDFQGEFSNRAQFKSDTANQKLSSKSARRIRRTQQTTIGRTLPTREKIT